MSERSVRVALLLAASLAAACPRVAPAQVAQPATDKLRLGGDAATTWADGRDRVVFVEGRATIRTDDATMSADRAVLWLSPVNGKDGAGGYDVRVALLGRARVERGDVVREGGELYVTLASRPDVELSAEDLADRDRRTDVHYLAAAQLRRQAERGELTRPIVRVPIDPAATQATTRAAANDLTPAPKGTVSYRSARAQTTRTPDGRLALVLSGDVLLVQQKPNGDRVELQAQNAVLFTRFTDVRQIIENGGGLQTDRDLDSAYLEQDVRIALSPENAPGQKVRPEQTLRATRVVYEFGTDRAVLTDALLHSYDPAQPAPLVVRAREMRKLGDTFEADHASITTSNFATPALALSASKVTVRQSSSTDGNTRTTFLSYNNVPRLFGFPVFYFPVIYGSTVDGGLPIRDIQFSSSSGFGTGLSTNWGLFETFGTQPPEGIDASYRVDYYSERGPALGFDTTYAGATVTETTLEPVSFDGGLTAYGTIDHGQDKLGRRRNKPTFDDDFRGRVRWNHQQFLTDGWQLQLQAAYVSDPTFLEEWFRNEFRNGLEQDTSLLVKRNVGNEVLSLQANVNFSKIATTADQLQEVTPSEGNYAPITVERLPQVEYHKIGESFGDDRFTWLSNNSAAGMHFQKSYATLNGELGFKDRPVSAFRDDFVGLPSYGYTGYTGQYVLRGDTRQEIAMPMGDDRVRVTPYVVGRYTAYSESPGGGAEDRLLAGVGVRTSTQFYKTYDDVRSTLFDLNRVRHVIEPQLSLFASTAATDRDDLYIYDENIDGVNDVIGGQFVIKQRFQTKRGGEGRYRSVDFFTLNTGVNVFAHTYDEPGPLNRSDSDAPPEVDDARSFRGLYYNSEPEASLARSTLFADSAWRVTDTTAILNDAAWNIDDQNLATAAVGLAVQREPRTRYFAGVRYIGELNQTIGTITFDYELSERYAFSLNQSINLTEGENQSTSAELVRRFEQFIITVTVYFDQIEDEGGIQFSVSPRDLPFGVARARGGGRS